jgi:CheY-like chemotaxis protein
MSGQLTASSVPGQGSVFTITLPRSQDMLPVPSPPPVPPLVPAASAGGARHRVLYIEDNPANIEVVSRFLRTRPNIALEQATSGRAGLEQAVRNPPDLILLDMHLPDLRGDRVLQQLKAEPATAAVPIAILSAEAAPAVIRRMRDNGVISYLTKPLNLSELGQVLDAQLAGEPAAPGGGAAVMDGSAPAADEARGPGEAPGHRPGRARRSGSASRTGPGA